MEEGKDNVYRFLLEAGEPVDQLSSFKYEVDNIL